MEIPPGCHRWCGPERCSGSHGRTSATATTRSTSRVSTRTVRSKAATSASRIRPPHPAKHRWCGTGTEFGVAWQDERDGNKEIYFARIDANGVKQGVDIRVTIDAQNSERPSLVWTGTEFVVAWQDERDGNKEIYLVRLNALGVKLGTDIRVTNNTENSERPSFAWTGTELALAWQDERDGNKEIYCARFAATGVKQGTDIRITNDGQTSERPSLVSTGSELGIAWQDERDGNKEVYFTRLTPLGIEIGDDLRVTANGADSKEVSLLWTGAAFAASWTDARDGNDEIYFATRGAAGEPRTGDARTTTDAASSKESSLAGSGTMLGIAWTDARTGSDEIFFQAVSL
jgi:hypothetical protein